MCSKKIRCRDGFACVVFYNLSCLYTAIHTPSFCGFRHCHPYIPLHFWKMFFILVYIYIYIYIIIGINL